MKSDEFFGTSVAVRDIGQYRLHLRDYPEHTRLPAHTHSQPFVTVVVSGGLREESERGAVDCAAHNLIVHAPEERHRNQFFGRRTRCLSVLGGSFNRTAGLRSASAAAVAARIIDEFKRPDALSALAIESLMLELFVATERLGDDTRPPSWLAAVRAVIEDRFNESLTLADLAGTVDVHPGHLARACRRYYGRTIGELVRDRRVAYARDRLASSASLPAIAHDAGFADQSHFTRTFRRATGMTPARYRRKLLTF